MPKFTQKYVLVYAIKDLPDGYEYSMADWPLHVTLADVFSIEGSPVDLIRELRECFVGAHPVKAKVICDEWFGSDRGRACKASRQDQRPAETTRNDT